jgi:hypothetical protein
LKLNKRCIKWSREILEKVRSEEGKGGEYKQELNHLLEYNEEDQNILDQE